MIAGMVLLSAALHPLWNMLLKGDADRAESWWLFTVLLAAISGTHGLLIGADFGAILEYLPLIATSWAGQILYGMALIRIYDRGDLSAYYPIVRASPIGIVGINALILGVGYPPAVLAGIVLTVGGAVWLQKKPGLRLLDDPQTLILAFVSMFGTAIYSLADARASAHVEPPVLFFAVEAALLVIYLPVMALLGHGFVGERAILLLSARPWRHLGAAVLCYASYSLILWSYKLGGDVAAVTTVRQASIPLSVLIGWAVLKELHLGRRLPASLLMVAGILVVIHAA